MKLDIEGVHIADCLSVSEFIKKVKERTGIESLTNQAIYHHLKEDSETLDYVEWCGLKMVVQNEKADKFTPGTYYTGRPRKAVKMQL